MDSRNSVITLTFGDSAENHERTCKEKNKKKTKENACYRCGRPGHYAPDCYASKHINGYYLD